MSTEESEAMSPGDSADTTVTGQSPAPLPQRIGEYRIVRKLGEGGMGIVYEAEQQSPKRPVALKVIRGGRFVDEGQVRLFRREAQTLGRLKHPGIAAIYESGRTEEGQHFFAMELVRGETLSVWRRGREEEASDRQELKQRLGLFRRVCEAVAYAHQRGVIHRDLKPGNVLVGREAVAATTNPSSASSLAGAPEIKILDFGLARITDTDVAMSTIVTDLGKMAGTPAYMSPEQTRGNPDEIDLRADVYSLGVILHELLTGTLPYDIGKTGMAAAMRVICEQSPKPLSKAWPQGRKPDRDLETIVLKALEKEPGRRYQSVMALSGDIERYLTDQPILARPASTLYQLGKMVHRHRVACALAASLILLLAGFAATMTVQAKRIARERDRANTEAETSKQVSEFLTGLFEVSDPNEARGNTITAREILDRGSERIERSLQGQPAVQTNLMATMARVYQSLGLLSRAEQLAREAFDVRTAEFGPEDPRTASILSRLGEIVTYRERFHEAEEALTRSLTIQERVLGQEHLDTGWTAYRLGVLAAIRGEPTRARVMLERALLVFEREYGPNHHYVAWCLNDLGSNLNTIGDHAAALPLMERALKLKEKSLGSDHPDVGNAFNSVGWTLVLLGRQDEAAPILERAVSIEEAALVSSNRGPAAPLHSLGEAYRRQGRFDLAASAFRRSLEAWDKVLGPESAGAAEVICSQALLSQQTGDLAEAERLHKRALSIREKTLGPEHIEVAKSLEAYAALLHQMARASEAAPFEDRARKIRAQLVTR